MSETGFTCPECGNTERFTANSYMVWNAELTITEEGWVDNGKYGEMDLLESTNLTCESCGYEDNWHMFEEGYE